MTFKCDGWPRKTIGQLFCQAWEWVAMKKNWKYLTGGYPQENYETNWPFGAFWCILFNYKNGLMRQKKRKSVKKLKTLMPVLYYIKLCASFQTHWWIQTAVTVQKCSIWVKISYFLSCVTLKFDGWPWQTIGHLFFVTSSFVNYFKAIGEFKLEWQFGNA